MAMPVVALLPTIDGSDVPTLDLTIRPFIIVAAPAGVRWAAHVASQLSHTRQDLILVFFGQAAAHAPAVGFARRALRRPAVGYVMVDPVLPQVGGEYGDWPDAPVTVVVTDNPPDHARDAAMQARLRGWQVSTDSLQDVLGGMLPDALTP